MGPRHIPWLNDMFDNSLYLSSTQLSLLYFMRLFTITGILL